MKGMQNYCNKSKKFCCTLWLDWHSTVVTICMDFRPRVLWSGQFILSTDVFSVFRWQRETFDEVCQQKFCLHFFYHALLSFWFIVQVGGWCLHTVGPRLCLTSFQRLAAGDNSLHDCLTFNPFAWQRGASAGMPPPATSPLAVARETQQHLQRLWLLLPDTEEARACHSAVEGRGPP